MVEEKVKSLLVDVLGLDDEERISMESNIFTDLAAESIDLIDICFRLEKDFKLGKVTPGDIFPYLLQEEKIFDDSGKIKETIIERLENEFPHLKGNIIDEIKEANNAGAVLKVKNIVSFVNYRLEVK